MTLPWTLLWLAGSAALAVLALIRERRPREIGTPPPLVPTWLLLGLGLIGLVVGLAHLVSLSTGHPLRGRYQP
jgi:drug/metabolite transporter (DMT)-like permease